MPEITLRPARPSDATALLDIYAPYVLGTAITYEYSVPTVAEFALRIEKTLKTYPYLVAQRGEKLCGYAYLSPFSPRAAGAWAAQTSIYLAKDAQKLGLGRQLYAALEQIARAQNIVHLSALVAYSADPDDPYLSRNSIDFHTHMGYRWVGEYQNCGCKFGRFYSLVAMEKQLAAPVSTPPPLIPFPLLPPRVLIAAGVNQSTG